MLVHIFQEAKKRGFEVEFIAYISGFFSPFNPFVTTKSIAIAILLHQKRQAN
jgi:hypothetical protein